MHVQVSLDLRDKCVPQNHRVNRNRVNRKDDLFISWIENIAVIDKDSVNTCTYTPYVHVHVPVIHVKLVITLHAKNLGRNL